MVCWKIRSVYAGATLEEVTAETVKLAGSDWELISLYYGSDLTQSEADKIAAELEALDGGWEVTVFDGGQPLYPLLLSLELKNSDQQALPCAGLGFILWE